MTPTSLGYWGTPTSSIDWCETNYAHSHYICEFFNTTSSLAMVLVGVAGFWLHRRVLELRFLLAFIALAVVGLGSVAFHATLRFELQMLDELPMLYLVLIMVFILLELDPARRFGRWLPYALAAHAVVVTVLCSTTRGNLQFFAFHGSFGSLEVYCLLRMFGVFRQAQSQHARALFGVGMGAYLVAIVLWFLDLKLCPFFNVTLPALGLFNPQFHAVWHALVSLGFYCLILLIASVRLQKLGRSPRLALIGGWFAQVAPS